MAKGEQTQGMREPHVARLQPQCQSWRCGIRFAYTDRSQDASHEHYCSFRLCRDLSNPSPAPWTESSSVRVRGENCTESAVALEATSQSTVQGVGIGKNGRAGVLCRSRSSWGKLSSCMKAAAQVRIGVAEATIFVTLLGCKARITMNDRQSIDGAEWTGNGGVRGDGED